MVSMSSCALLLCITTCVALLGAGVIPWAPAAAALSLGLVCVFSRPRRAENADGLAWAATALVLFLALTALPLPSWLYALSPGRAAQHEAVRTAISDAAERGLTDRFTPFFTPTRNRAGTLRAILLVLSGLLAAGITSRMPVRQKQHFLKGVVILGTAIACAGFVSQWVIPQGKTIWWCIPVSHGRPAACFVNRNHYGGFLAMLCPAATVLAATVMKKRRLAEAALWIATLALMTLATAFSLSRGAWIAWAAGMLTTVVLLAARRHVVGAVAAVLIGAASCVAVLHIPHSSFQERLQQFVSSPVVEQGQARLATWRDSLRMLPDYPLAGVGASGFHMTFPQYRQTVSRKSFHFAENEYVQVAVEGGLVGTGIVVALIAFAVVRWKQARTESREIAAFEPGLFGVLAAVGIHATLDFALRVPLYVMVFLSLAGLLFCAPRSTAGRGRLPARALPAIGTAIAVLVMLAGGHVYSADNSRYIKSASAPALCRALAWSPTSWYAWYRLGRTAIKELGDDGYDFGEACMVRATQYNPKNYRLWYRLAETRKKAGDMKGAREAHEQLKRMSNWLRVEGL